MGPFLVYSFRHSHRNSIFQVPRCVILRLFFLFLFLILTLVYKKSLTLQIGLTQIRMSKKSIKTDKLLIAACGLYCGACRKYLSAKCPGCHENKKASWCRIRSCAINKSFHTCAECARDVTGCKVYSNLVGKIFAVLFRSDRPACIRYIKEHGEQAFAEEMTRRKCQTIKRK